MDRRKTYRVAPEKTGDISLRVQRQDGPSFSGQVLGLSIDGVGACSVSSFFPMSGCPALAVGEEVELTVTSVDRPKAVVASAMVVRRADKDDSYHYGFRFINHKQVASQLSLEFLGLFNRRASYRVPQDPEAPVAVTMEGESGSTRVEAQLVDISAGGVGLRVPAHAELGLVATKRVKVSLSLPDCRESLNVEGVIRNRNLVGASGAEIHYGIEFDWERSHNAKRQQEAMVQFLMNRQRDLLRKSRLSRL